MVVHASVDGCRAKVSAFHALDRSKGVNFHTFSPAEDCCLRLLVKNTSRKMHYSVVHDELETMIFSVQGLIHLRSGGPRPRLQKGPTYYPHFIVSMVQRPQVL